MKTIITFLSLTCLLSCSPSDNDSPPPEDNNPVIELPTINIGAASNITQNSATLSSTVENDGGANVTSRGFCWSVQQNPSINDSKSSQGIGMGSFSYTLTGLDSNSQYYVRAYAINEKGTKYSAEQSFTTLEDPQNCSVSIVGDFHLQTQSDIDAFGLNQISIVDGSIIIGPNYGAVNDPIVDLSALSCLREVSGTLIISGCNELKTLHGLENLQIVQERIGIDLNPELTNLEGLNNIDTISSLLITGNSKLTNLSGLENLKYCWSLINISGNDVLNEINALSNVTNTSAIEISNNPLLENLSVFNNLENTVLNFLLVRDNLSLLNLDGFQGMNEINYIEITGNPKLQTLSELSNITHILNSLIIERNDALTDFEAFSSIEVLDRTLSIQQNPVLTNVDELSGLTSTADFNISDNKSITDLNFQNLKEVKGNFKLAENPILNNLDGFSGLTNVSGLVSIRYNESLTNLNGLSNLIYVGQNLLIYSDGSITDICGIRPLLMADGLQESLYLSIPNLDIGREDIIEGNCSL